MLPTQTELRGRASTEARRTQVREAARRLRDKQKAIKADLERRVEKAREALVQQRETHNQQLDQLEKEINRLKQHKRNLRDTSDATSDIILDSWDSPPLDPVTATDTVLVDGVNALVCSNAPHLELEPCVMHDTTSINVNTINLSLHTAWNCVSPLPNTAEAFDSCGAPSNLMLTVLAPTSNISTNLPMMPMMSHATTSVTQTPHQLMASSLDPVRLSVYTPLQTEEERVRAIVRETIYEMDAMIKVQPPSLHKQPPPKKTFKWEFVTWTHGVQMLSKTRKFFTNFDAQRTAQFNFVQSENKLKQVFHEVHENKPVQNFGHNIYLVHSNKEVGENHVESFKLEFWVDDNTPRNGPGHFVASRSIARCPETGQWVPTDEECAGYHYQNTEKRVSKSNAIKRGCCITGFGRWQTSTDPKQAAKALEARFPSIYLRWEECYIHPLLPSNPLGNLELDRFELLA